MIRAHVFGASGYAGAEVIRYLSHHPHAELGALISRSQAGTPVGAAFPALRHVRRPFDEPHILDGVVRAGDAVFLAASHSESEVLAPKYLALGATVIDLSPQFRTVPAHGAVYGFPERHRAAISNATLVANPGCYPTAAMLALLPLAELGAPVHVVVDAKSGITGAGRSPATASLFAEVEGDVRAYGLEGHRHEPEIAAQMAAIGWEAPLLFTPQVVPLSRGMLASVYCTFSAAVDASRVAAAFERTYAGSPFVRVGTHAPSLRAVCGTNDAEVFASAHGNVVRVLCAIDNLGKGAAGQAVQNFNLMHGFAEETGFHDCAIVR